MALEISIPKDRQHDANMAPQGIDLPAAYIKVGSFNWHFQPEVDADGNVAFGEATATFGIWPNKNARDQLVPPLGSKKLVLKNPNMDQDILSQMYEALKASGTWGDIDLSNARDV